MSNIQRPVIAEKMLENFFATYVKPFEDKHGGLAHRIAWMIKTQEDIEEFEGYYINCAEQIERDVALLYVLSLSIPEAFHYETIMGIMKDQVSIIFRDNDFGYASNVSSMYLEVLKSNERVYEDLYAHIRTLESVALAFKDNGPAP